MAGLLVSVFAGEREGYQSSLRAILSLSLSLSLYVCVCVITLALYEYVYLYIGLIQELLLLLMLDKHLDNPDSPDSPDNSSVNLPSAQASQSLDSAESPDSPADVRDHVSGGQSLNNNPTSSDNLSNPHSPPHPLDYERGLKDSDLASLEQILITEQIIVAAKQVAGLLILCHHPVRSHTC